MYEDFIDDAEFLSALKAEDNEESENKNEPIIDSSAFENAVAKVLRGYPDITDKTIDAILANDIQYNDLASLNDEDFQLFGIADEHTRAALVRKFSKFMDQKTHFENFLLQLNPSEYQEKIYENVNLQLNAINLVLKAAKAELKAHSITENVLIEDDVYVTTPILKTLQEINVIFDQIKVDEKMQKKSQIRWTTIVGGVVLLGMGCFGSYKLLYKR